MASTESWKVLSASPLQLELKVREAGLAAALSQVLPSSLPPMPPTDEKDAVAFRTGVVFTIVLLSGRESDKDTFLSGVRSLRDGLAALGTGQGWMSQIDEAITFIENDAASREDMLKELDALIENSVPEEGWGPGDKTGPMVQAGAWLMGFHLTASAIVRADRADAADALLKRPDVAAFFLKYLETEDGASKASFLRRKIVEGLTELRALADKDGLTLDDVKRVEVVSGDLIKLVSAAAE